MRKLNSRGWVAASRLVAVWLAAATASVGILAAENPPTAYRRVLVPAAQPLTWPRGKAPLIPVEAQDFDAWIAAANAPPATAALVDAEYQTQLNQGKLVGGHGRWRIVLHGELPALLPLGNASILLNNVRWTSEPTQPARLGWWPGENGKGLRYALQVPSSGELEFDWTVTGPATGAAANEFPLRLPPAASTRVVFDLPAGVRPTIDGGVTLQSPAASQSGGRWVLALGPTAAGVVRIEDSGSTAKPRSFATSMRQTLLYDVNRRGVELDATLRLAATEPDAKQLNVTLPAGLQLVQAVSGENDLAWRIAAAGKAGGPERATIQLPVGSPAITKTITLRAWGPLVTGRPLKLSLLAVDDTFWNAGTFELSLDGSLRLRELLPIDCVQTSAEPAGPGRRLRFAAYSPSASVEMGLDHRTESGEVRMGSTLEIGSPGVSGRLIADVSVDRGRLYELRADVRPGWTIDAVETIPAGDLAEWYVDRSPDSPALEIRLDHAISPGQSVRVIVTERLERAAALEPLPLERLNPLIWRDLATVRNLLQLRAAEQFELQPVGNVKYLAAEDLTATERGFFTSPNAGRLCDLEGNPMGVVQLAPKRGTYDATVQINAQYAENRLRQTYRIECRPQGGGIDHVLVYLSEPLKEPPQWVADDSQEPLIAERMPANDPRLGGLPPGGELWMLHLQRSYARPIAISAEWSAPWPVKRRVPLVSLPDAATQQGRVAIWRTGGQSPTIVAQRMSAAPLPVPALVDPGPDPAGSVRAVYRFQPTRFYDARRAPDLWLGPPLADDAQANLVANKVDVESRILADGSGVHRVRYELECLGANSLELTLPEGARLAAARLNGRHVTTAGQDKFAIPLSGSERQVELELELTSKQSPLASGSRLPSPLPTGRLTILDGAWTVMLPQDFTADDPTGSPGDAAYDWRGRMFGPLARPQGEPLFNPLAAHDWNALWIQLSRLFSTSAEAAPGPALAQPLVPSGWHSIRFRFMAGPPTAVTLIHWPATNATGLAIFLLCIVVAGMAPLPRIGVLLLALSAAALSLFLSAPNSTFATAAALGFGSAALWHWWQGLLERRRLVAASLALLVGCWSSWATAAPRTDSIESVLVPIDADGNPAGTKYFVGSEFLDSLLSSADGSSARNSWLLTAMRCDGELTSGKERAGLRAGKWTLSFEIDVFTRDAIVELPLLRREAVWQAAAAIDGIPAPLTWDESGRSCRIQIAEPGHCRLCVSFEPHIQNAAGREQLRLSLPPIAGSAVSITTPATVTDLQTGGICQPAPSESQRCVWQGCLPASGALAASWSASLATSIAGTAGRLESLRWLHVQPDGLTLDAIFTLGRGAQWPDAVDVTIDDGWQLLADDGAPALGEPEILPAGRQLFRVPTASPNNLDRAVALRFRARDSNVMGNHRLPNVEVSSFSAVDGWVAVSCDPSVEVVASPAISNDPNPPAEISGAWGSNDAATPQIVANATQLAATWYLSVRPRVPLSAFQDRLSLLAEKSLCRVQYESEVTPQGADCFGCSLAVPADLAIEDVKVTSSAHSVPLEWVRSSPTQLAAFFAHATRESYRIELTGSVPPGQKGQIAVPRIVHSAQPPAVQTAALYRSDGVRARWQFPSDVPEIESAVGQTSPFDADARFVSAVAFDATSADRVSILTEANQPTVDGDTLTVIARQGGVWVATYSCDLHVGRGELDELHLQIPTNWAGPYELTPEAKTEVAASGTSVGVSTLSIRLTKPVEPGAELRLQLQSPLALADGALPSAPQIALTEPGERRNFLALPTMLDGESDAWARDGIEPAKVPPGLQSDSPSPTTYQTFRTVSTSWKVALRPRSTASASASISLAETAIGLGAGGATTAVARFVIIPAGLAECQLELPEGDRLVRATLEGEAALLRPLDHRHWQVQLGPPNLPQVLEIVTRGVDQSLDRSTEVEVHRPVLLQSAQPIPVDLSLWTLCRAAPDGTPSVAGGDLVRPAELAGTRLDRLASISQSATRSVVESPLIDGYSWFARWEPRLLAAERLASSLERAAGSANAVRVPQPAFSSVSQSAARCDAWREQMAEVFAAAELSVARPNSVATTPTDAWPAENFAAPEGVAFISDGDQTRAVVHWTPVGLSARQTRWIGLGWLAVGALVAAWIGRTPQALKFAESCPELVVLGLGITAWACLRPGPVGLLAAALSLAWLARRLARDIKSPRHGSSNQPSETTAEMAKH
jgi:hypothetical protein